MPLGLPPLPDKMPMMLYCWRSAIFSRYQTPPAAGYRRRRFGRRAPPAAAVDKCARHDYARRAARAQELAATRRIADACH